MAFTLIFEGDLKDFEFNPLKIETPFGKAIAAAQGDALEIIDDLEAQPSTVTADQH